MTVLPLEPKLDLTKVAALTATIRAHQGSDLVIDANEVNHLGALGLQVLVSAAKSWRESGHSLTISPRSEAFEEALGLYGVSLDDLQSTEAA